MTTRDVVEDFLYDEAALLDGWELARWLALWTTGGPGYLVPAPDAPDADPRTALFLVADDLVHLRARVDQLLAGTARAETPLSRTTRVVGNVRVLERDGLVAVASNLIVHRAARDRVDTFAGRVDHELVAIDGTFRIRGKRVTLTTHTLEPGRISILL